VVTRSRNSGTENESVYASAEVMSAFGLGGVERVKSKRSFPEGIVDILLIGGNTHKRFLSWKEKKILKKKKNIRSSGRGNLFF